MTNLIEVVTPKQRNRAGGADCRVVSSGYFRMACAPVIHHETQRRSLMFGVDWLPQKRHRLSRAFLATFQDIAPLAAPQPKCSQPDRVALRSWGGLLQHSSLSFEQGPTACSVAGATYFDASDQAESRIYGGIHPSVDDYPAAL